MRVLVTGATGLLGNNIVRQLIEGGNRVRVLTRRSRDVRPLEGLQIDEVHGDIRHADDVFHACRDVDTVIHCAADVRLGWSDIDAQRHVNVEGTRHVAAAAMQTQARLVHVSTVDTLGVGRPDEPADEESPRTGKIPCGYVITKREAEDVVRELIPRGLNATIVHPGFMLGPWDWKPSSGRMLLTVAQRFVPMVPTGGMSLCDVRDVAAGTIAAAERGEMGRNYVLAGHNLRIAELWQRMAAITGGHAPAIPMGPVARWIAGRSGDLWTTITGREPDLNSATVAMAKQFHYYHSGRAQNELGYQVRPVDETLADAWAWFQNHGYA